MMVKKKHLAIVAAAICAMGTSCWYAVVSGTVEQNEKKEITAAVVRPVPTAIVQDALLVRKRLFPGTVQAQSRVEIAFSLDGLLVELNGQEGKSVQKGEVLAKIDQRDFIHRLDAAKANYLRAETEFSRTKTLQNRKVISQAEYDNAKTAFDVARAELRIREKALGDTVLVAPYDGVVAHRYVENHEHIKKQASVLAFKDISKIDVVIQVPEGLIAHGGTEEFKDILVNFDADGERWFPGVVREFRVLSDPVTRTYEVAVSVKPPNDLRVLPGMTATVSVTTPATPQKHKTAQNVRLVPVEAVFGGSDGNSYAWVIPEAGGSPHKTKVTLGALCEGGIEIIDSLETGQRVAVSGVHSLHENMQVRPVREGREGLDG
ncbi:MAG: efflux RND transporter periplasmic adaptor subunit [Desulforhopalus sp.]|nr:efflux RND transporter periplasmic adaptor subunit [Desulforhopalus sp.]